MCTTVSYFLPRGSSSFSFTGLFLLFRKKTGGGGARAPPAPPLATALETAQQLTVAAGLREENEQSRGFDHAQ